MKSDFNTTLAELKVLQKQYEEKWWEQMPELEDIRHTILHAQKMIGMWATIVEVYEHHKATPDLIKLPKVPEVMKRKLVANLLIWALHYANLWDYDIKDLYEWKCMMNKTRSDAAELFGA